MLRAEDDARREIAERDVGRRGNRPPALEIRPVEHDRQRHENQRRPEHPADGRGQRHAPRDAASAARRRAPSPRPLPSRRARRKRHADVVDDEVQAVREARVAFAVEVRPDERDERAEHQQPGIVDERFVAAQWCRQLSPRLAIRGRANSEMALVANLLSDYRVSANVSHARGSPVSIPRLNHDTRCAELPCVNDSGAHGPGSPLQSIVADRRRGVQPFFDVARIELDAACGETPGLRRLVSPHAGITIGLQLDAHRPFVRVAAERLRSRACR